MEAASTPTPTGRTPGGSSRRGTMRAIRHRRFGAPVDAVEMADIPVPEVAPDEVLVRVAAAGVAVGDWLTITGVPLIARPMFGIRTPKRRVAGLELAGRVVAPGAHVTRFAVGDEVFGWGTGALAQYAVVPEDTLALAPTTVNPVEAAAVPVSGVTALQAVRDHGEVSAGQTVLVIGASGAVGSFAVQIAKAFGAGVTGVAGSRNLELLRSIGADHVIDYRTTAIADAGVRFDVIIDIAGNTPIGDLRSILAPDGTLVIVGGSGGSVMMGYGRTLRGLALSPFVGQSLTTFIARNERVDLEALAEMIDAGSVTPLIDRTYSLDQTADALEHVGSRHASGKTVVTI